MWILGLNIGHNGSAALFKDDECIFYIEEERLSRLKYDANPFLGIEKAYEYTDHIDYIVLSGTRNAFGMMPWTQEDAYSGLARKKQPGRPIETIKLGDDHHLAHALTAFYNSGFDDAVAIVADGAGSGCWIDNNEDIHASTHEVESIWEISYPANIKKILTYYGTNSADSWRYESPETGIIEVSDGHGITKVYEAVTQYLGWHAIEAGKTMGLSPYGKPNPDIKFDDGKYTDRSFIKPRFPSGSLIRADLRPELNNRNGDVSWHDDPDKLDDYRKDLAYEVQKSSERRIFRLVREAIELTGKKKIVMSGGFFLNCVCNYELLKEFPDVEFYHEPAAHDGGNAIGAAYYVYRRVSNDSNIKPLGTLYLGPDQSKKYDNVDWAGFDVSDTTPAEVAKLIRDKNIVCIFQGRSEGGPRALGNRSILFDPTVVDGKDIVNQVKRREWFRPFAGSVLVEHAKEWFDLRTKDESPFMMYAVNVHPDKVGQVPAITHVDNTCRVQTVSKEQNPAFYDLISEFHKLSGVPILFNTSFNLAGDPLVETIKEALNTLERSELNYLYLPDIGKLVKKSDFTEV